MVSISRKRIRRRRNKEAKQRLMAAGLLVALVFCGWNFLAVYFLSDTPSAVHEQLRPPTKKNRFEHPDLKLQAPHRNSEEFNAIALDILRTLECSVLFNKTTIMAMEEQNVDDRFEGRRLEESDEQDGQGENLVMMDDYNEEGEDAGFGYNPPTAAHLFCLAAYGTIDKQKDKAPWYWKEEIKCDATGSRQQQLLELWGNARGEFPNVALLKQVLKTTTEQSRVFVQEKLLNLWLPQYDEGIEYIISVLTNPDQNADEGGVYGLSHNLGVGKLFVDVGSCLGLTSLAMAILYPGTRIVSIEAAPPNWMIQKVNWICQPDEIVDAQTAPTVLLAGVGPVSGGPQFAPVRWAYNKTTSVRGWSPANQATGIDVEFNMKLTPWHSLLTEAGIDTSSKIDVLNVDCEGCEYNLIPALGKEEFDDIPTVMGEVHWGYIPKSKKPSSTRAKETHERLCIHENFVRTAKECCAFPDLPVRSSVPGNILVVEDERKRMQAGTVRDVAGALCDDFEIWKTANHLEEIDSDWGWFELTSIAADNVM